MITVTCEPLMDKGWPDPDRAEQAWEDEGGCLLPRTCTWWFVDHDCCVVDEETFKELLANTRFVAATKDAYHDPRFLRNSWVLLDAYPRRYYLGPPLWRNAAERSRRYLIDLIEHKIGFCLGRLLAGDRDYARQYAACVRDWRHWRQQ